MSAVTFDTLKLVDALEKVDIPRAQARAIVDVVRESHDAADVATKGDIALLRKDVEAAEQRVNARVDALENRLIIKLSAVMAGLIAFAGAVQVVISKF